MNRRFRPALFSALRQYSPQTLVADSIAGVTVGLVALPLAMAFAISSGMSPQAGIYCAIVTGFIISACGGSYVQIGGPTGAFVVVIAGIIQQYGIDGLFMCTMMAGVVLVLMGLTGTGTAVRFIPRPVVIGFTNGIALVIASTQLKDFFGIALEEVPGEFIGRIRALADNAMTSSTTVTALAVAVLVLILVWNRLVPRVPGYIVALAAGTAVAAVAQLPVETIGSRFGGIPAGLPQVQIPRFRPELILSLVSPTLTVAMLGAIESLLSAVVADRMSGTRHNSNVELFAQGIANIASPLFGGLPATGAIARTATNVRSGAKTPVAGIIHAFTLLLILLYAAPLAALIPMSVLAAILLVVAYNMGEWREIPELWKQGWTDRLVWMVTFALTVLADLTVAVEAGMILAAPAVHPAGGCNHDGQARVAGLHQAGVRSFTAGQGNSPLRVDRPHPGAVPLRRHRQAGFRAVASRRAAHDRHPAASQHDSDRRHRPQGDSGFRGRDPRLRPIAAAVRRAAAARAADGSRRVSPPCRQGEHPAGRQCRPAPGEGNPRRFRRHALTDANGGRRRLHLGDRGSRHARAWYEYWWLPVCR
jgi:SulP family sulfate permease